MDHLKLRAGLNVYDVEGRYVGVVVRVYPVPPQFAAPDGRFGCCKVRRSPLPIGGPPPLLLPFTAIDTITTDRAILAVTRAEAAQWAQGQAAL